MIWKALLQVRDIWNHGEVLKWLLLPLDQKCFQKFVFEVSEIRKRSGFVDRQQVRPTENEFYPNSYSCLDREYHCE